MALNTELLLKELRHLTIFPEQHDQGLWVGFKQEVPEDATVDEIMEYRPTNPEANPRPDGRPSACGSFGCLAGNTAIHAGSELDWYLETWDRTTVDGQTKRIAFWTADNILGETYRDQYGDWVKKSIERKAMELFDMTPAQADRLFDGDNSLDTLWERAEQISGGEITSNKDHWHSDYAQALRDRDFHRKELEFAKARKIGTDQA